MKKAFSRATILFSAICFYSQVYAGGCHLEEVSPSKNLASIYMADEIRNRVLEIDAEYKRQGKDLQVVMIARSGESLESFDLVKDDPSQPLQKYLDFLAERAYKSATRHPLNGRIDTSHPLAVPRDLVSSEKLEYSHVGFLMKKNLAQGISPTAPEWMYIVHLLAECDEKSNRYGASDINYEKLKRFFWDTEILDDSDRARKAMIIVPQVEIQANLAKLLHDAAIAGRGGLHEPKYNVASTPFTVRGYEDRKSGDLSKYYQLKDQNSNQWPLEMIAAATKEFGEVRNRMQAQEILYATNYRPSLVLPTGIKGAACQFRKGPFGIWDASNLLNCKDQVYRNVGLFQLITVKSLYDYMNRNQYLTPFSGQNDFGTTEFMASTAVVKELDEDGQAIERVAKEAQELAERKKREGERGPRDPRDRRRDPRGGRPSPF